MPEFRQDPSTKEWVIIAVDRVQRPDQFREAESPNAEGDEATCPFCPGNERLTPEEVFVWRDSGLNGQQPRQPAGWR